VTFFRNGHPRKGHTNPLHAYVPFGRWQLTTEVADAGIQQIALGAVLEQVVVHTPLGYILID